MSWSADLTKACSPLQKLYPANATTNSSHGVTSIDAIMPVLERMEKNRYAATGAW